VKTLERDRRVRDRRSGDRRRSDRRVREASVSYGSARTPWGRLWAAMGEAGVVAVALGAEPVGKIAEEVRSRHPARLVHDPDAVAPLLEDLATFLAGGRRTLDWEPDYAGLTPFRRQVYEETRRLPYGTRIAYVELARRVSSPRHAHAVGTALAKNPFRLLVPDHRVVEAGGAPGGYRFGRGWKSRLLALEQGQTALEWINSLAGRS
jgi:O-6-methylguanine DNA methyltransferase